MDLIKLGIEQIKTLHQACADGGINPPFTLDEFQKDLEKIKEEFAPFGDEIVNLNVGRFLSSLHKVLHEILYIPPRR